MKIELDHFIVPSRDKVASAQLLSQLLGVSWSDQGPGPFAAVYINAGLTLDFIDVAEGEHFEIYHFAFRVSDADFDTILGRIQAAGIAWRSDVRGPVDMQISTAFGGRSFYWNEPDGHQWELLTVSYAREPAAR